MEAPTIEVFRKLDEYCSQDEYRKGGAASDEDLKKGSSERNVQASPIDDVVYLRGDLLIIDAYKIFSILTSLLSLQKLPQKLQHLRQKGFWDCQVTYRGYIAYLISSEFWDQGAAFEISRTGKSLGLGELPSRYIGVVPKEMVDLLLKENGKGLKLEGGVSVEGVDGRLILSGDGDFVISGSGAVPPVRKVSRWIEDECVRDADILCATGGRWTFCDDSSDEDDEYPTDEDLLKYLDYVDADFEWDLKAASNS